MSCQSAWILLEELKGKGLIELKDRELGEVFEMPSVNVMSCHLAQWCLQFTPFLQDLRNIKQEFYIFSKRVLWLILLLLWQKATMAMFLETHKRVTTEYERPTQRCPNCSFSVLQCFWVCWGRVSGAQWMIHQDHSQHVTVPVLCQLSHKPLFIFTRDKRWGRKMQQCSWILMLVELRWDRENIWIKSDKRNFIFSADIKCDIGHVSPISQTGQARGQEKQAHNLRKSWQSVKVQSWFLKTWQVGKLFKTN